MESEIVRASEREGVRERVRGRGGGIGERDDGYLETGG